MLAKVAPKVLMLMTEAFRSVGGVQITNRRLCKALCELPASGPGRHLALCLGDIPGSEDGRYVDSATTLFRGFNGNEVHFTVQAIKEKIVQEPDIILATHVNLAPLAFLLHLIGSRVPYVVMAHGIEVWDRLTLLRGWALRNATAVFAVSDYTRRRLCAANGVNPAKVRILPHCLDPVWVQEKPAAVKNQVKPEGKMLLSVGRVDSHEKYKGHEQVIRALPKVRESIPNVFYVVVGEGDDIERLGQLAQKLGVGQQVIFAGKVTVSALHWYYEQCDLYVMPSSAEGFGLVFLEAMYHRKAVVAGNTDASREVVREGETGILVDPSDVDQVTDQIIHLLSDPDLCRKMGEAGYQLVRAQFMFTHFLDNLQELIGQVLSGQIPDTGR